MPGYDFFPPSYDIPFLSEAAAEIEACIDSIDFSEPTKVSVLQHQQLRMLFASLELNSPLTDTMLFTSGANLQIAPFENPETEDYKLLDGTLHGAYCGLRLGAYITADQMFTKFGLQVVTYAILKDPETSEETDIIVRTPIDGQSHVSFRLPLNLN